MSEPDNEFLSLAREAAEVDTSPVAGEGAVPMPPEPDVAQAPAAVGELEEARAIIALICTSANALLPFLAPIYTDEVQARLAAVTAPLLKKYGITAGSLFERYREEIAFGVVAVPLAGATYQAFRAHRAQASEKGGSSATVSAAEPQPAAA